MKHLKYFDFEHLYTYWALKDLIQIRPWVDENCDDGSVMKIGLFNKETKQQMTVVYKRFYDGRYELKHIQADYSTSVTEASNGNVSYYVQKETYFDEEAQAKMDNI